MGMKLTEIGHMQPDRWTAHMEPTLHSISCIYVGLTFWCKISWKYLLAFVYLTMGGIKYM